MPETISVLAASLFGVTAFGVGPIGAAPFVLKPIAEARLRYEHVDQPASFADALTLRLRAGAEARRGGLSLLAEAEATIAPLNDYNAFPFPAAGERQRRPQHALVADPENLELNRLQLRYEGESGTLTLGRQRINLDDQRWVGSVGWRQNEQTFDAVRGEAKLGTVSFDLGYAISQRTIFGEDAGARAAYGGDFVFAGLSSRIGRVQGKLFAYLVDYQEPFLQASSSQTYGLLLSAAFPLTAGTRISLKASYARQSDFGANPGDYAADYSLVEASLPIAGFTFSGGRERLGSNRGRAVQTPLATLHKFNGWADMFLTTPAAGLEDVYVGIARALPKRHGLPGFDVALIYHRFNSATGDLHYGEEWNASLGFKTGRIAWLAKYADYHAAGFGLNTRKFWLQAEIAF